MPPRFSGPFRLLTSGLSVFFFRGWPVFLLPASVCRHKTVSRIFFGELESRGNCTRTGLQMQVRRIPGVDWTGQENPSGHEGCKRNFITSAGIETGTPTSWTVILSYQCQRSLDWRRSEKLLCNPTPCTVANAEGKCLQQLLLVQIQ